MTPTGRSVIDCPLSRRLVLTLTILLLLSLPTHGLYAQEPPKGQSLETCTALGCELMSATISIQRPDGEPPNLSLRLVIDGVSVICPVIRISDYPGDIPVDCGADVSVIVQPLTFCADFAAAFPDKHLKCPYRRAFEELVHIHALPHSLTLALWQGKHNVATRAFLPEYKLDYPNGERCGHPCKYWRTTWVLD